MLTNPSQSANSCRAGAEFGGCIAKLQAADNPSDETLKRFLEELLSYPGVPSRWRMLDLDGTASPFLTINYKWKNATLRLFSTLTMLGTPLDVGLQELRIESFFPADEATRVVVNRLAEGALSAGTVLAETL